MTNKQIFDKYRRKLAVEARINAALCGCGAGFAVMFVVSAVCWLVGYKSVWLSLGAFALVAVAVAVLLYMRVFRPDDKTVARRLDDTGLQERIITMTEYASDDGVMAGIQRADATARLAESNGVKLPFRFFGGGKRAAKIGWSVGISALCGIAMFTVLALTVSGLLPSGNDVIFPTEQPTVCVSYIEEDGGYITGETDQIIAVGGTTTEVTAVAEDGYAFVGWSDGYEEPTRSDYNVQEDMTVFARFEEAGDGGDGGDGDPSDEPSDEPEENEQKPSDNDPSGGGDVYKKNNTVLDGETDYKDVYYDYYYQLAMEYLASGNDIPDGLRDFLNAYIGLLN